MSGNGVGGRNGNNFRLGACIVGSSRVLSCGTNSYNGMGMVRKRQIYSYPYKHAEAAAIVRLGLDSCDGTDLYVTRVKRNGELALARPCNECMRLIEIAGIRNVYYSVGPDQYAKI